MIATLEADGSAAPAEFSSIGEYLRQHAQRVPLEQQIGFGLHAQRYCRALGLPVVRFPGQAPRLPLAALDHVRTARYAHWSEVPGPDLLLELAGLCAAVLQHQNEVGPFTFAEFAHLCREHGYLPTLFKKHDTEESLHARLGRFFRSHAGHRLPNECVLHISTHQRRTHYRITRHAKPTTPTTPA
jgi:hypothetical protein